MPAPCDLGGRGVLVTRPAAQADGLCRLIEAANGRAIRVPSIEIAPVADPREAGALLAESWDMLYFVSPNAVEQALALVPDGSWPGVEKVAAVGRATAQALTDAGRAPELVPEQRFDSETLLAMPELADMRGRRVLIVRGEGGRALFAETLRARGAEVRFAEVYCRLRPAFDPAPLLSRWTETVAAVTATSDEVMLNLMEMLGPEGRAPLLATPLVVVAERTAEKARGLGFVQVAVAERAEDAAIVRALCALGPAAAG
ncbi:uroporphyrinogen-III synthase [Thiocapsa roseopersicina]|uniref:Uroporphyrinogen-III synthase n=1 Tax=Thiocapsa roseopersicina TaxID=1058 RepID=A0A1H2Q4V8_THIRO|nr:uroporphyrinogen-III synthase [Thiocapsa roseopersicina]SDW02163.1 uroporphyrinogen-III synthase [Thiocapsa roseopersicina]